MRGVITAPKEIITGAFNVRFDFIRPIDLIASDITVETLEGDALGHTKDSFGGSGANYHILCYIPDARSGKSRISVNKAGLVVEPVIVEYDTVNEATVVFLDPYLSISGKRVEVPVLCLGGAIQQLRKRNIEVSPPKPIQVYGEDNDWTVSIRAKDTPVELKMVGRVKKESGLRASLGEDSIRIDATALRS